MLSLIFLLILCVPWLSLGSTDKRATKTRVTRDNDNRCPLGRYSQKDGKAPCLACPEGTFTKEKGMRACTPARAGYYVAAEASTTETPCPAGSLSGKTGSRSCEKCPAGYMCPSNAMSNPQQCSPGRYSTGGVIECGKCPAGTFNSIHRATDCCQCAAGWYNDQPGNTNCQRCSNQYPYSGPGTGSRGGCTAAAGRYQAANTCVQKNDGTCPDSVAFLGASPRAARRRVDHAPLCKHMGQKACPVYSLNWNIGGHRRSTVKYECVNIEVDLESCGGCVGASQEGNRGADGGRDCSAIPYVGKVSCRKGECIIERCSDGYSLSKSIDGERCVVN